MRGLGESFRRREKALHTNGHATCRAGYMRESAVVEMVSRVIMPYDFWRLTSITTLVLSLWETPGLTDLSFLPRLAHPQHVDVWKHWTDFPLPRGLHASRFQRNRRLQWLRLQ